MTDPQQRDRRRPFELLGFSAVVALVIGAVIFMATRSWQHAGLWAGVSFIVVVVCAAMLVLTTNPDAGRGTEDDDEDDERPSGH